MLHATAFRHDANQRRLFQAAARDKPLVAQLAGDRPADLAATAQLVVGLGAAALDLNLGCPQDIAQRGNYGAYLLEQRDRLPGLVRALQVAGLPVGCKVRLLAGGIDESIRTCRMLEAA